MPGQQSWLHTAAERQAATQGGSSSGKRALFRQRRLGRAHERARPTRQDGTWAHQDRNAAQGAARHARRLVRRTSQGETGDGPGGELERARPCAAAADFFGAAQNTHTYTKTHTHTHTRTRKGRRSPVTVRREQGKAAQSLQEQRGHAQTKKEQEAQHGATQGVRGTQLHTEDAREENERESERATPITDRPLSSSLFLSPLIATARSSSDISDVHLYALRVATDLSSRDTKRGEKEKREECLSFFCPVHSRSTALFSPSHAKQKRRARGCCAAPYRRGLRS